MTLIFDLFIASAGPAFPSSEEAKDCRVELTMQSDESVGMSVQSRGFVQLPGGMTADQHQNVPRAKRSNQVTNFAGPVSKDYLAASTASVLAQGKPSGTTVVINLRIEIDNDANTTGQGQLTADSLDVRLN